jgi:tetratricopeptide (TPR) repeat protein
LAKLFLSYAREDAAIAARLARALERGGEHDVWWDRDLHGGASFGTEIEQQLRDCDVVIVLWSPTGIQSPWVRDEAAIGRDAGKLIPVSIGSVEPPIGFRQFHTIEIGRNGRLGRAAISKVKQALQHSGGDQKRTPQPAVAEQQSPWMLRTAIAAMLLVIVAGAAIYWWRDSTSNAVTVAIVPGPGQPPTATEYANALATDVAAFLSAHGESASVLAASDPEVRNATYRFTVGYSGQRASADTSLSMSARGEEGIVWSKSWSSNNPSAVDLKKQLSFGASRALLCALETRKGSKPLKATLLRLYIAGCSDLYGGAQATEPQAAIFAQVLGQQPQFAPAWENLAIIRSSIFVDNAEEVGEDSPLLRDAAFKVIERARKLAPRSGKLLFAEANLAHNDWQRSLALLDRAIAADPNQAIFYAGRAIALQSVGRMRDAIADADRAVQLDPLSPIVAADRIYALMYGGSLAKAKDEIANAYKIWPNDRNILGADSGYSMRYGDPRHGEEIINKNLNSYDDEYNAPARKVLIARENPTPENVQDAVNIWRAAMEAKVFHGAATTHYMLTLGTFGKMDEAWRLVADPDVRPLILPQTFFRPEFESMRDEPRFMALAAQYGLVRYWRWSGHWPDFCDGVRYDCKTEAAKYE